MDTKEWMKKYLSARKGKWGMTLLGAAAILMGLSSLLYAEGDIMVLVVGVLFAVAGVYMVYNTLNSGSGTKNWLRMMEREGKLETALADFRDAGDYLGGELRLGRYWCFGKGGGIPTAYGDIVRVYQHVHKTNSAEDGRSLMAVTTRGVQIVICQLPLRGKGDQELNRALNTMLSRNPNIQIGYKK